MVEHSFVADERIVVVCLASTDFEAELVKVRYVPQDARPYHLVEIPLSGIVRIHVRIGEKTNILIARVVNPVADVKRRAVIELVVGLAPATHGANTPASLGIDSLQHSHEVRSCRLADPALAAHTAPFTSKLKINRSAGGRRDLRRGRQKYRQTVDGIEDNLGRIISARLSPPTREPSSSPSLASMLGNPLPVPRAPCRRQQ